MRIRNSTNNIIYAALFFIVMIFIDDLLVLLLSITKEAAPVRVLLYSSEFIILFIGMYLLFKPLFARQGIPELPAFIALYVVYIILMCLRDIIYTDTYNILRDSRKMLAPVPPLVIGFYLALYQRQNIPVYINRLIKLLTVLSVIGLVEWVLWYIAPDSLNYFYSRFFRVGLYYHQIKYISDTTDVGLLISALRPNGFIIPALTKRLTGLYLEPFSAGFNAALAVAIVWYRKLAQYPKLRYETPIIIVNFLAVILTTSRSAYLMLAIITFVYMLVQKRYLSMLLFGLLSLIFVVPYYNNIVDVISTMSWAGHIKPLYRFFAHFFSFNNILGLGLGTTEKSSLYTDCGYGSIYGQLGIIGIISILILYLSIGWHSTASPENRFFITGITISTFVLLFFAGYPFGYKTYGLIHLCLGTIMGSSISCARQSDTSLTLQLNNAAFGTFLRTSLK
jgi:hypothetical protein